MRYTKGGVAISETSRAEYFKKRRENKKHFNVLIDKEKAEAIEEKLKRDNRTKASWLEEKIEEDTRK